MAQILMFAKAIVISKQHVKIFDQIIIKVFIVIKFESSKLGLKIIYIYIYKNYKMKKDMEIIKQQNIQGCDQNLWERISNFVSILYYNITL